MDAVKRLQEISAAWEVWGERQHEVRRLARMNQWAGDLPVAAQARDAHTQFEGQIAEAYARARLQCAIVYGVDGVDQTDDYDAHWHETWGADVATRVANQWIVDYTAALERQTEARTNARLQAAALSSGSP